MSDKVEDVLGMISKSNKEMNVSKFVDEPIDLITSFSNVAEQSSNKNSRIGLMRQMDEGMAGETITEVRPEESCSDDDDWVVKSSSTRKNMPIETMFVGENIVLITSFCEGLEKTIQ